MSEHNKPHITSYLSNMKVLLSLLVLTFLTIAVTFLDLGALTLTVALLIACVKATVVLLYFMHLKYENKLYGILVGVVMLVFLAVVIITFLDYLFR